MTSHIQHKPGCMALINCTVYHADGICPGPYGKCTCDQVLETPTVKEDTKKECGNHDWTYIPGNGQLCKNCGKVLRQGHVEPPEGPIRVDDTYSDDDLKEPARKLPSERIRELGGIKHHFMLDGFEGNTELKVINHAIDELSRRLKGVIEYLDETK